MLKILPTHVRCKHHKFWELVLQSPIFLCRLTTDYPKAGKLFPFGGKNLSYDQLRRDKDVRFHGKRVMETVGEAVNGLDDLDLLVPILQDLAKRHVGYKVTKSHFTVSQQKSR